MTFSYLQPPPGTEYMVMECIVMEGGDDITLEPGDIVKLVKVEGTNLRVVTTDEHPVEGTVPESYLRRREKGRHMEGQWLNTDVIGSATHVEMCMVLLPYMHLINPLNAHNCGPQGVIASVQRHCMSCSKYRRWAVNRGRRCSHDPYSSAVPKFTMSPADMTQTYGSTATISAAFNGYPAPSIIWRKDREALESGGRHKITSCQTSSVLEIIQLEYQDNGVYTCFLTNSVGSDSASMVLSVHGG